MMPRAKKIYIFHNQSEKVVSVFLVSVFRKGSRKHVLRISIELQSETLVKVWENSKKLETLACGSSSHGISRSSTLPLVFLFNN